MRITNVLEIRGEVRAVVSAVLISCVQSLSVQAFSAFRRGAKSCFFEMHIKLKWEGGSTCVFDEYMCIAFSVGW